MCVECFGECLQLPVVSVGRLRTVGGECLQLPAVSVGRLRTVGGECLQLPVVSVGRLRTVGGDVSAVTCGQCGPAQDRRR